jgi:mono/diheme cytochrome c family protein
MLKIPPENRRLRRSWTLFASLVVALLGCEKGAGTDTLIGSAWAPDERMDAGEGDAGEKPQKPREAFYCRQAEASERIPARTAVIATDALPSGEKRAAVFTSDLYNQFVDHCGTCHANGTNQGGFSVTLSTFASLVTGDSLTRIRSEDAAKGMPRPFKAFSQRSSNDPIIAFANALEQWLAAGAPADVYYPSGTGANKGQSGVSPYLFSREVGMGLTNLGNCVPGGDMRTVAPDEADELDRKFEAMSTFDDLPLSLSATDLTTLDAAALAQQGVIGFAPGYTLWADYAKKMRHIRVPRGTSIAFDSSTQTFDIPPNTRFYKTFLKPVTDLDGQKRYRKMETRLIVSRPDEVLDDGTRQFKALFATYKWNDDETEATLHKVPYRDGTGFTDDLVTYVVDERLEDKVVRSGEKNLSAKLLETGATRHYALPGSERCIHCHMGTPSFVLGFTPLQINRRPMGEGGVIEPAEPDELNQLQRLIDYGLITGLSSPDDVVKLEDSQGERKPRNDHELIAQGYMLGNCAHCHNPNGFPSQREKVLADVLDFMPSEKGGIFQFPLDKYSPRTFRGDAQDIRIPYITPSLFDHPVSLGYTPKWINALEPSIAAQEGLGAVAGMLTESETLKNLGPGRPLLAPWRSLIYRNVDTPFSYEDSAAIFPHMPMDTPGYDCRARRIMGTWMVSIPAVYTPLPVTSLALNASTALLEETLELIDKSEQPYKEAAPSSTTYNRVVKAAAERVTRFQSSERFQDCPAPELDLVAPEVSSGQRVLPAAQKTTLRSTAGNEVYSLPSPARPHYTKTDLKEPPLWVQRRPDWYEILVRDGVDKQRADLGGRAKTDSADAIAAIGTLRVTDAARKAALTELPFGIWKQKDTCAAKLAALPKAGDLATSARPSWMNVTLPAADAPLYTITAGGQVFSAVCSKCHGAQGTGVSALANTIADLTGGLTRVANLRDGLFGPPGFPGSNRKPEFMRADGARFASTEDWVARYVAWMGLGGTNATIPTTVVKQIGTAAILGEKRKVNFATIDAQSAANMLGVAKKACELFLPRDRLAFNTKSGSYLRYSSDPNVKTLEAVGLIEKVGDGQLWEQVCYFNNPQFVRVVQFSDTDGSDEDFAVREHQADEAIFSDLVRRSSYPGGALVGDQTGKVVAGIQDDNLAPWCVHAFGSSEALAAREAELGSKLPLCPPELFDATGATLSDVTADDARAWATRGAANAGLFVYLYLDALAKGEIKAKPAYDRCEDL